MKKSKRSKMQAVTFSLVLCLLLALTVTACGSGNGNSGSNPNTSPNSAVNEPEGTPNQANAADEEMEPEAGAKLMVWEAKEQVEYMKQLAADFEKEYGVPVKVEELAGGDQGARLATDGPSKLAADVLTLPHDQIGQAVKAGLLLPNDIYEEETKSSMVAAAVQASTFDGILYGYPKSVETYALFYNKDLIPEAPKTWDDLVAFAKTYNKPKENKFAVMWEFEGYYTYPFIGSFGGYIYGKDNTDFTDIGLNNEGTVKGFTFLQSLKEILPLNAGDITYDVKTQLFQEGKLAMNIDGPWSVAAFKDHINLGVAPLPKVPGGEDSISFSGVKSYYVNSYTQYPAAARMFAHFASSKENQIKNYEMTGAIPANIEAGEAQQIKDDPIISGFFQQFQNSVPMPSISEIKPVWVPLKAAFVSLWNDTNLDVKQTLDQAAKSIKADLESK